MMEDQIIGQTNFALSLTVKYSTFFVSYHQQKTEQFRNCLDNRFYGKYIVRICQYIEILTETNLFLIDLRLR
jgi:hypothetical protein